MKRHGYYKAKYDILYQRNKTERKTTYKSLSKMDKGIKSEIESQKNKINSLKKQLLDEENNLLKLYKSKKQ
jgi:hypothetical protein